MTTLQPTNNAAPEVAFRHFADFAESQMEKMKSGQIITGKGVFYSDSTIRQYKMFADWWREFEASSGRAYEFAHLMPKLVKEFELFLTNNDLCRNSIGMMLAKLKSLLKMAFLEGLHYWNGSGIKAPSERTTKIFLSFDDLRKLTNSETQEITQSQQKVLDVFICQCFLGLRYDTLRKFLSSPFSYIKNFDGKNYVDIVSDKTGEQSVIPLGATVQGIIMKYGGLMPDFSEAYVNRQIKKIAEIRGLSGSVAVRRTVGGKVVEEFKPKYGEISTHSARRTFISLLKTTDISDREICAMSGHTSEQSMRNYSRLDNFDKIKGVIGHSFFNIEL